MSGDKRTRKILDTLFHAAVTAADPAVVVPKALPSPPQGRTVVVGAGKASAGMAAAVESHWPTALEGVVITRYGHGAAGSICKQIDIVEAAHPVPDEAGRRASKRICALVQGLTADDLVIALMSGGGSSLLAHPLPGINFTDKQAITKALLRSGATISEMNVIRQHLSAVKGGRLAAMAHPAKVVSLILSDVPGDAAACVASGPTVPTAATREDALAIVQRYALPLSETVRAVLMSEAAHSPSPEDPSFTRDEVHVVASARQSLNAACQAAKGFGLSAVILSDQIEGEARDVGKVLAALAREVRTQASPFTPPVVMVSGGETTVTVKGSGRGGRNSELGLAASIALRDMEGICGLAADTDGLDGVEDNAGAFFDGQTFARLRTMGLDPFALLANNDAYAAFRAVGDLFITGPTGTNVNDVRAFLIDP